MGVSIFNSDRERRDYMARVEHIREVQYPKQSLTKDQIKRAMSDMAKDNLLFKKLLEDSKGGERA